VAAACRAAGRIGPKRRRGNTKLSHDAPIGARIEVKRNGDR
jgi:hypothetical protein